MKEKPIVVADSDDTYGAITVDLLNTVKDAALFRPMVKDAVLGSIYGKRTPDGQDLSGIFDYRKTPMVRLGKLLNELVHHKAQRRVAYRTLREVVAIQQEIREKCLVLMDDEKMLPSLAVSFQTLLPTLSVAASTKIWLANNYDYLRQEIKYINIKIK